MSRKAILSHSDGISQCHSGVVSPDGGLRILARLIARDLLSKRQDNTNKKTHKKVGARKYRGVAHEDLY